MSGIADLQPGRPLAGALWVVRKLLVGGSVAAAVVVAGAVVLLRGRSGPPATPDRSDASSAALPLCPKGMVRVPGAEATTIGNDEGPSEERPAHATKVSAFCIDLTEVTVAEFQECVYRKGCSDGHAQAEWNGITKDERVTWSALCNGPRPDRADHPMNCVSFDDAAAYCGWAGKRLPTEEQWEYAARGTDSRAYPWGHEPPSPRRVNGCDEGCSKVVSRLGDTIVRKLEGDDCWEATSPTGAFPEGVGPFGTFDMAGNVAEWVDAPFCNYGQTVCGTAARVIRGGSWVSDLPRALRTTSRTKAQPGARLAEVGFRCVK